MIVKYNNYLNLDINTGKFYYIKIPKGSTKPKKIVGQEAGNINTNSYITICNNQHAHKLFTEFIVGKIGNYHIDHINGIRNDNRPENLRIVTVHENLMSANLHNKCYSKNRDGHKFRVKMNISHNNFFCSKSLTEKECIDLVKTLKLPIKEKLAGILTLRQIIDHMIDYNLLQNCTVST